MRFTGLEIVAFGPLVDRSFAVDSDSVLIHGPNEAGKSSFRAALETLLYGFAPANRDQHPLAQWDPDRPQTLELRCELQLGTGERIGVERLLQSSGGLRVAEAGAAFAGPKAGNRALPWIDWLAREVFNQLYSLELEQLAKFDASARAGIDDLLLPRTSALPLRAASEILSELRKASSRLWRADKRGNSAARELREKLKQARDCLSSAQQRDRELRDARTERAQLESGLHTLRARKRELERERADASFLGELFEWNRLQRALGDAIDLAGLGDLQLIRPRELDAEIEKFETQLRAPRARLARAERALPGAAERVLERTAEIERASTDLSRWQADRERLDEQRQDAAKARERARDELRAALGGQSGDAELSAAAALPIEALASAATEWSDAREREFARAGRGRARIWQSIAGCAGIALLGLGLYPQRDAWLIAAGALLLVAALCVGALARPRVQREPARAPRELEALLGELAVPEALSASPAALQRLVALLVGIQRSLADARERERLSAELEGLLQARATDWKALCERAGVHADGDADGDAELLVARLHAALESARGARNEVERDRREREGAQQLIAVQQPLLDAKFEHRARLRAVLGAAEPECGDFELAFERVKERQAKADFLRRRQSELRGDPRFARFESDPRVVADPAPADAPWFSEISDARDGELDALDARASGEQHRLGQLSALLGGDAAGAISDASDAQREIRDEIEATERERDRLALLESILARAEREFRERHQPDVLRRASHYLERITGGRYRRIDLLDGDPERLAVALDGRSEPIEVKPPISQGTLDQIFLCLRLGMLDHLDEGRERLPLILDDALLRMDDQRRREVYALLAELAPTRQLWILTCNRALADEIESQMKVSRIEL